MDLSAHKIFQNKLAGANAIPQTLAVAINNSKKKYRHLLSAPQTIPYVDSNGNNGASDAMETMTDVVTNNGNEDASEWNPSVSAEHVYSLLFITGMNLLVVLCVMPLWYYCW